MLKNDEGTWIKDPDQLEIMVTDYYKTLFKDEDQHFHPLGLAGAFPVLDHFELHDLVRSVTREEIYQNVKRMGIFKAPGPDGFQSIFFQNTWQVVGNDLCDLVCKIFEDPNRVKEINGTLITLIPKKEVVTCMKDFRPISLCNVSYKVVTKILTQRLRDLMGKLVGPCQSSFIPNRHSGDNIIVAQEVFHSMR